MKIPNAVVNLMQTIQWKSAHPEEPKGSYFGRLQEFFDFAVQSAGASFNSRLHMPRFNVESFKEKTIRPFLSILNDKIEKAFSISEQLKVSHQLILQHFQRKLKILTILVKKESYLLLIFIAGKLNSVVIPSLVSKNTLPVQYKVFKIFVFKDKLK